MSDLHPPFIWRGGKGRQAAIIHERFGDVKVYVEPFAGSIACLLQSPPHPREIVCDTDSFIAHFWRAMQGDPAGVAKAADYPTFHDEYLARQKWLVQWAREHKQRIVDDADFYDVRAAGYWAYIVSNCIGDWSATAERVIQDDSHIPTTRPQIGIRSGGGVGVQAQRADTYQSIPHIKNTQGGVGVQVQRVNVPKTIPKIGKAIGGFGVSAQRIKLPTSSIPAIPSRSYGQGVQATKPGSMHGILSDTDIGTGARLLPWFLAIQKRLERVVVLNRQWPSALTPSLLMQTETSSKPLVGILLDPPYKMDDGQRLSNAYASDFDKSSTQAAEESYAWAIEHGRRENFRICYCCQTGDFPVPDGWTHVAKGFKGVKRADRREERSDLLMFSPACLPPGQIEKLF